MRLPLVVIVLQALTISFPHFVPSNTVPNAVSPGACFTVTDLQEIKWQGISVLLLIKSNGRSY